MSPPLRTLLLLFGCATAACGPSVFDSPLDFGGDEARTCNAQTCDGCCLGGRCVEAAAGCAGRSCLTCLGAASPAAPAEQPPAGCSLACSGRLACQDGACVREVGRTCTAGEACALGTSCRAVDAYLTSRCLPDCARGTCPEGFTCFADREARPTCVPVPRHDPTARFELRQLAYVDPEGAAQAPSGAPWKLPNDRPCYGTAPGTPFGSRVALCLPTRAGTPSAEFRHWLDGVALSSLTAQIWRMDEAVAVPGCEQNGCSAHEAYHVELAAQTGSTLDLRPAEGHLSQTFTLPLQRPDGTPTEARLQVLIEQVR